MKLHNNHYKKRQEEEEENDTFDEEVTSPLHVLLYGLAHHEVVDCRSVVNSQSQHHVSTYCCTLQK